MQEGNEHIHKDAIVAMGIRGAGGIDGFHALLGVILELSDRAVKVWVLADELFEEIVDLTVGRDVVLFQSQGKQTPCVTMSTEAGNTC